MSEINNDCETCTTPDVALNCPIRMSDGRLFTDYRPRCAVNNVTEATNNGLDSYKHRMFMINNATEMMKQNMMKAYDVARCKPVAPTPPTVPPPAFKQACSSKSCVVVPINPLDGIGLVK